VFYYCFSSLPAIENLKNQLIFEFQVLLFGEISPIKKKRLTILPSSHAKTYRPSCLEPVAMDYYFKPCE
jgi:hypothetical protein